MVEQVLRKAEKSPAGDLSAWSRSVIKRALERAGKNAAETPDPLPAEGQAGHLASSFLARPHGPEVIVFMSLSAPAASWREWSREAARAGVPLVLRGLVPEGLQGHSEAGRGVSCGRRRRCDRPAPVPPLRYHRDPRRRRGPGRGPALREPWLRRADAAPPHDRVMGNIGLEAALAIIAEEGGPGRATARRHLAKLRGDSR